MAKATPYSYAPIRPNQLRLLKFVRDETSVSAVLKTFSLDQPLPPYHSLSYTWATDGALLSRGWNILINKQQLLVLDTLQPFISVLRSKGELLDGTWWWIDSICINQSDLEERAQQIQHMQYVYGNADRVIIWLGEESNDSNLAMEFVRHLDKISREKYHIDKLRAMLQTDEYLPQWAALKNLLSRRWWSRMWSVQEFVLPPSISFWCGTRNASRVAVCRTLSTADKCTSVGIKQTPGFTLGNNRRRARGLYKALKNGKANVILSLPALAAYFSCMNATDDRDRLYGLMGLCTDKSLLEVDYFLSTEEVYLGFAQAFITQYKSLDIISFASIYSGPSESWPSWVPRWQKGEALVVPLMVSQSSKTQIGNLRTPPALEADPSVCYAASGNTEAICKLEGSRLLARGVVIDTVDGLAASKHFDLVQSSTWTSGEMPDSFFSPKDILTSVCRSVVLDRKDRYLRYSMPTGEFFRDFLQLIACLMTETHRDNPQELQEWYSWTRNLKIQGHSFESIVHQMLRSGIDTQNSTPNQDEYYHDTFFGRFFDTVVRMSLRLMVTRGGHVGMVAEKAKKGDLVCMLYGCSVLVLLREDKDRGGFAFISECFLDGYMDGQGLMHDKDSERIFCII
ncbi:hypothetical protein KAF25_005073 [Fusarium avenaceum]|uniref:Heterokaryon incompatibility domain-containing protein n=1 Tax=Fusarium avenaceum TaxID=40199 RepID=A0A9P7KVG5_9HYPO|nr:hypothetical protein KAF25_005073 [Fusarium avenaceum]